MLDPISILLALTNKNLMKQSISYLFWGQGETALMAYTILVRYWERTKMNDGPAADFSHERLRSHPGWPAAGPGGGDTCRKLL